VPHSFLDGSFHSPRLVNLLRILDAGDATRSPLEQPSPPGTELSVFERVVTLAPNNVGGAIARVHEGELKLPSPAHNNLSSNLAAHRRLSASRSSEKAITRNSSCPACSARTLSIAPRQTSEYFGLEWPSVPTYVR
jgi:hypothetical protein